MTSYDRPALVKTKWEYLAPIAAFLSLIISCITISRKKYFWNDELLSFYLLDDKSFSHMMGALSDTINNAPPLYFVLGWVWAKVFTSSELSLRLFSCFAICAAFAITWIMLRRTYDFWPATISNLSVFCLSYIILHQNTEARFYGLFLFVCSLGVLHFDSLCRRDGSSVPLILAGCLVHAAIIQTHLFGFLYSGAILLALIVRDAYFSVRRPKVYLSVILGWGSFVLWIGPFLNQLDLARPRPWIPPPSIHDLFNSVSFSPPFFIILLGLSGIILITNVRNIRSILSDAAKQWIASSSRVSFSRSETSLLILAYSFLALPLLAWVVSHTLYPIFMTRYTIPTQLSWSIILAALISRILIPTIWSPSEKYPNWPEDYERALKWQGFLLTTVVGFLLLGPIAYAAKYNQEPKPGSEDATYGNLDLPVAVEFSHQFLRRFHYSPDRLRYFFILDWDAALKKGSGSFPPMEYKTMNALRRNYPHLFQNNIVHSKEFLQNHKRFLVLNIAGCLFEDIVCHRWFEMRIKTAPEYTVQQVGIADEMNLMLVEADE